MAFYYFFTQNVSRLKNRFDEREKKFSPSYLVHFEFHAETEMEHMLAIYTIISKLAVLPLISKFILF